MTTNNSVNVGLSGSTGTGNFVGANTPTLITPLLGTPTSGTLTSCTGLPLTTGVTGVLPLANGGTNGNLTASNGGIFYSTASAGAILSGTATAGQLLRSGASTTPTWTTTTYPTTNAVSTLLYASSANVMAALATANNSILITNGSGVPSIGSNLPSAVMTNGTYSPTIGDGTNNFTGLTQQGWYITIDYGAKTFYHVTIRLQWTGKGSASGTIAISLPATPGTNLDFYDASVGYVSGITYTNQLVVFGDNGAVPSGMSFFDLSKSGGTPTQLTNTAYSTAGQVRCSVFFST